MKKKTLIITIAILLVLAAALTAAWLVWREKPAEGSKTITIEVVNKAGESTVYDLKTDAEYLRQAMEEAEGLEFTEEDGMVLTVNGESAVWETDGAYWGFYVNEGYCNYGIDTQPVADGDAFQIVYTVS